MALVKVVAHPTTGAVITPSASKPEYGTFRVDQEKTVFVDGFMNVQRRTAFVRGRVSDLESLNLSAGKALPGTIQRQESFAPFYEGQEPKINPQTQEAVLTDGKLTYMQSVYVQDADTPDVWVGETSQEVAVQSNEGLSGQAM